MVELGEKRHLHEAFRPRVVHIGNEQSPLLVVDHFLRDPQLLIDHAAEHGAFSSVTDTKYPGVRAPLPHIYSLAVRAFLGALIADTFGLGTSPLDGELAFYSLVTTRPEQLQLRQRMPHFDSAYDRQLAVLHYLSPQEQGGTSFYRHRATGYETIRTHRIIGFTAALETELAAHAPLPARYIDGDTDSFQRFATVDGTFNRLVIYRSVNLHSPDIPADFRFDSDPRSGRLTVNLFFKYASQDLGT